jgi:hypothetical protein
VSTFHQLAEVYRRAIAEQRAIAYADFYTVHHQIIAEYAERYNIPVVNAAICYARLSPRTSVSLNTKAYIALITGAEKPAGVLQKNWCSAVSALHLSPAEVNKYLYGEPLTKVRCFCRNLLFDCEVITIDSIMLRVLQSIYTIPSADYLFHHYSAIHEQVYADFCRLADTPPYVSQAIIWGYARHFCKPVVQKGGERS